MRQRHFNDMVRIGGLLSCPIAKRRAESVYGKISAAHALAYLIHRTVIKGCSFLIAGEYEIRLAWERLQNFESTVAKRDAVFLARFLAALHARRWDRPSLLLQVDFRPTRTGHFPGAGSGQNQEFESTRG